MAQMVIEDVIDSYKYILMGFLISMIVSLIFIAMMRWVAAPLVWLSVLGVIGLLSYGECHARESSLSPVNEISRCRCLPQLHEVRVF